MKPGSDGLIAGLTVMDSGAADEAVFINIAGAIEPARLGKIAAAVGMNGMFDMMPGLGGSRAPRKAPL